MKLSFSTIGCPEWSWDNMLATAKDLGFDGIEIRGIENELNVPKAKPFLDENICSTKDRLRKLNIEIPCLTSSCYLFDKMNIATYLNDGKEYIELANKMNTSFVRVLGDRNPEPSSVIDVDFVAANISVLAAYAQQRGVTILIETNGIFANSDEMLKLVKAVNNPNLGVLWDIHHPFRFMNETIEKTFTTLKDYIKLVHVKDSLVEDGKVKYKIMGLGDIPVKEALNLLKSNGYEGYISLEWVKRWCNNLEEPGIVFPHFLNYVKEIIL